MRLSECPECSRHIRTDARVCPFCDHVVPASGRARAGALLVGAAAITTLTACPRAATKYGGPPPPEPQAEEIVEPTAEPPDEAAEPEDAAEPEEATEPEDAEAAGG